ncbi:MAG: NUMOD3 domain-containing DNA-binding protein [Candidatus Nanopelagicales bacterium]|nr:NUMOD3 domain-containing DNA-binding protein [Candidatus Nanopelagicales bacterium]
MTIIGAYLLIDVKTGKFYVGSSGDIEARIKRHLFDLNKNQHHCHGLQKLWWENKALSRSYIPTNTREDAYVVEAELLDRYKDSDLLLNIGLGVKGGDNLTRNINREKIIAKITESVRSRMSYMSATERKILFGKLGKRNGMWGKTHSAEARAKIAKANLGRPSPLLGLKKNLSPEMRKRISDKAKKRIGALNPFFNKKHSVETRRRLSELAKAAARTPPNAKKVKIDDTVYNSATEAARKLNVSPGLILYKVKSEKEKYTNYRFVT